MASAVIKNKNTKTLKANNAVSYAIINVARDNRTVKVEEVLPFRIKFTNIGIPGYGINNPARIGIAVIGLNNYIL